MMTHEFGDLAFIIPLRVDSEDRLRNLKIILAYLEKNFPGSQVLVVEQAVESRCAKLAASSGAKLIHMADDGPFSRSRTINNALPATDRPIVCIYDADMLAPSGAIRYSLEAIRGGRFAFMLPFNRTCVDVDEPLISELAASLDGERFGRVRSAGGRRPHPAANPRVIVGGILVADRATFIGIGGMNREMISYGWEDVEILSRAKQLGYYYGFSPYSITHLNHARGADSSIGRQYAINKTIYDRVREMSRATLVQYVADHLLNGFERLRIQPRQFSAGYVEFAVRRLWNKVTVERHGLLARFIGARFIARFR